jgi:hypothetical protein
MDVKRTSSKNWAGWFSPQRHGGHRGCRERRVDPKFFLSVLCALCGEKACCPRPPKPRFLRSDCYGLSLLDAHGNEDFARGRAPRFMAIIFAGLCQQISRLAGHCFLVKAPWESSAQEVSAGSSPICAHRAAW